MMKYYTGVGSRDTPSKIEDLMESLSRRLAQQGYCLRSGNAAGADKAFFYGLSDDDPAEIYLPNADFNMPIRGDSRFYDVHKVFPDLLEEANEWVKKTHPRWFSLKDYQLKFHTRNVFQVLGQDLKTPSEFLVCYAEPQGNSVKGGTGTAVRIANMLGIPVYNFYKMYFDDIVKAIGL